MTVVAAGVTVKGSVSWYYSLTVIFSETGQFFAQLVPLGFGQIDFIALGEHVQQEDRNVRPRAD